MEVKLESLLSDSRMIFVETQFAWQRPVPADQGLKPKEMLTQAEAYAGGEALNFLAQDEAE